MTTAPPPESLLVGHIQAHIKQGEKAKERADQARDKAEQHLVAAGRYLTTLKAHYAADWAAWEFLLKTKVNISTGRASELMQLADGRKDLQQIRDGTAQRVKALRAARGSSLQGQCNEEGGPKSVATPLLGARSALGPPASDSKGDAHDLIDALVASSSGTRAAAAHLLIAGPRASQFESATNAVADLYQTLARAGR
jgi:hypothetical protein